jgi:hypothetical protein
MSVVGNGKEMEWVDFSDLCDEDGNIVLLYESLFLCFWVVGDGCLNICICFESLFEVIKFDSSIVF